MSVYVRAPPARVQRLSSHGDPYQLYELRRPHERASNVVPQLPRQPDYAPTRLRYRRIIAPPTTQPSPFPPAFRPARAASFGSSELSSLLLRAHKPLHASARGERTAVGKMRRCFQRVHRSYPFRKSFKRTANGNAVTGSKTQDVSSDFDISSDEDEDWDEYESRRRNSLHLPSSNEAAEQQEDDKLARCNTAPVVIESLCKPKHIGCVSSSSPPHSGSALVNIDKQRDTKEHQHVSAPPRSCFPVASKMPPDRLHRTYSEQTLPNESGQFAPVGSATCGKQPFAHRSDHHQAALKRSRTFHASDLDRGDLSVSFVMLEHRKKSSRTWVGKFVHALHMLRLRAA